MKLQRVTGALVGLSLSCGIAYAVEPQGADAFGATAPRIQSAQPAAQPSAEETLALQMLMLQMLMMQSEPGAGESQMIVPRAETGTRI